MMMILHKVLGKLNRSWQVSQEEAGAEAMHRVTTRLILATTLLTQVITPHQVHITVHIKVASLS